jgi:hypothetical protein
MLLKGPEDAKVKVVGWRWGKFFFPCEPASFAQLLFPPPRAAGKNVQVTRAANLQLDVPVFLLSCEICPKEWEVEGVMDVREQKC